MINIMSGTTAVTLSPSNNATKNGKSTKTSAGDKNSAVVSSNNNNKTAGTAENAQVQNAKSNQHSAASSTKAQVQQANTQSIEYTK